MKQKKSNHPRHSVFILPGDNLYPNLGHRLRLEIRDAIAFGDYCETSERHALIESARLNSLLMEHGF